MDTSNTTRLNTNGGVYASGIALTETQWIQIFIAYEDELDTYNGKCTCRRLGEITRHSHETARKAIYYYDCGMVPQAAKRGHGRNGLGAIKYLSAIHHAFIYQCYLKHPECSKLSYTRMFREEFNMTISETFISLWFKRIGPFKGNMRLTSKFPPAKDSWETSELLHQYLSFISSFKRKKIVFADEKPFKGIDIYSLVRRDPFTGVVPYIRCDANVKNRYNVLAAITLKRGGVSICARVVELNGDAIIFQEFVGECIREAVLERGDIFVVDNCTIHCFGENESLQEVL